MDFKEIIAAITVFLVFFAYVIYIKDVLQKKTIPHIFSFFIWGLAGMVIYALQVHGGAGVGAYVQLGGSLCCLFIFFLGLRIGDKDITRSDVVFLIMSLVALGVWLIIKQPVTAMILLVFVEVLGFIPTIRKAWNRPHTETLSMYHISTVRQGMGILALQHFNLLTLLNPIVWTLANGIFGVILIMRRRQLAKAYEVA